MRFSAGKPCFCNVLWGLRIMNGSLILAQVFSFENILGQLYVNLLLSFFLRAKKTNEEQNTYKKFPRDCPTIFWGFVYVFPPPP